MAKNLIKKILEPLLIGAILFGNSPTTYAPPSNIKIDVSVPVHYSPSYRKLSDSKSLRKIRFNQRPKNIKKVYKEIVSYGGETDTLYIPEYRSWKIPSTNCSRYSRFSSEDVFGLKYNYDEDVIPRKRGAWNLKYYNKIVKTSDKGFSEEELEKLSKDNVLQPGMMILFYNPKSNYKNWKDKTGKKVKVTHSTTYLGNDPSNGDLKVMNQLKSNSKPIDINYLLDKGWLAKEILDAPDSDNKN
jgi:hypothetical protein